MKYKNQKYKKGPACRQAGLSLIEIILAAALFVIFASSAVALTLQALRMNRLGEEETIATQFAEEGIEAVRSIKNQGYSNVTNSNGKGIVRNAQNIWEFTADGTTNILAHNATDNYIRSIAIEAVQRNATPPNGDIVSSGGTVDPDTKKITSTVTWNFNSARAESISLTTYLSNWRKPIPQQRGGMLAYGNGGTTSDAIQYRILDGPNGTWSAPANTADIDTSTTNRALRAARIYSSPSGNEKILISKHYNGTTQYIYGQVFNGTSWGNVQLLASWNSTSYLDVLNFDGDYIPSLNGFLIVYSDNTTIPKFRIWNGSWSIQLPTSNSVGGIPNFIVFKVRPGTSEAMMVTFDQLNDTNTVYFSNGTWSAPTEHSVNAPTNTKKMVDFTWNPNSPLKGALIFSSASSDTRVNVKIWTADGTGGGSWATDTNCGNIGRLGTMDIDGRLGADEFLFCNKDVNNDIYCFQATTTLACSTPSNNLLTANTDPGIQRSFDFSYEAGGSEGLAVYSNNTSTPRFRLYNAASNSFGTDTQLTTAFGGTMKTASLIPVPDSDDVMILMADSLNDLYSIVWDGTSNAVYTTPSGKARSTHGTNGSSNTDFWYDFAWDRF